MSTSTQPKIGDVNYHVNHHYLVIELNNLLNF